MPDVTDNEEVGLVVVWFLAALAGSVDACGASRVKHLYVSFMSGNTTSLGIQAVMSEWSQATLTASVIALFVAGAAAGTVAATLAGRRHLPVVLLLVAAILAASLALPAATVLAMAFAMGALNSAMQRAGPVKVSVTYVTGTLVKLGQGLGHLLCGNQKDWAWLQQAVPWTGLLAGALGASLAVARFGERTLIALPVAAAILAMATFAASPQADPR